ncbi:MAG: HD domain-containing protein [Anaerolineae bacterium]
MNSTNKQERKRFDINEVNKVLRDSFPTDDEETFLENLKLGFPIDEKTLLRIPFGKDMREAINKPHPEKPGDFWHRKHIARIIRQMNILLQGDARTIIKGWNKPENAETAARFVFAVKAILGSASGPKSDDEGIWRLEAFLHDVGKALTPAKHAERGARLVDRLRVKERDNLRNDIGEDNYNQLLKVINFHDRFGVLSTGEASFGILADAVDPGTADFPDAVQRAAQTLSHIMILNLIDIGASVPWGLQSYKVKTVIDDWELACWGQISGSQKTPPKPSRLQESRADRPEFERLLIDLAAEQPRTIARVERLLSESYRRARHAKEVQAKESGEGLDEFQWPKAEEIPFWRPASQALETAFPLTVRSGEFRRDFAHVVKMDYLLYLTDKVTMIHWDRYHDADSLATIIVAMLDALVEHFGELSRCDDQRMRIGIDLSVLRDTPDVQWEIAKLLSGDGASVAYGLDWLKKEVGAWPF